MPEYSSPESDVVGKEVSSNVGRRQEERSLAGVIYSSVSGDAPLETVARLSGKLSFLWCTIELKLRWRGRVSERGEEGVRAGVLRFVVDVMVGDTGDSTSSRSRSISWVVNKFRGAGTRARIDKGDVGTGVAVGVVGSMSTYNTCDARGSGTGKAASSAEVMEGRRWERLREREW